MKAGDKVHLGPVREGWDSFTFTLVRPGKSPIGEDGWILLQPNGKETPVGFPESMLTEVKP